MTAILKRFPECISTFCVSVFHLKPCVVLIRGMLIIVWPHGCLSSLREETETGVGCWEVRQHHLSCHLCYGSHGIQCVASERQSCSLQLSHTNLLPLLISLELNTMWINKRVSLANFTLLTFIQVIGTKRRRGDAEWEILNHRSVYSCKCQILISIALFAQVCVQSLYVNVWV